MDVNNTRFHLVFGRRDWAPMLPDLPVSSEDGPVCGIVWDEERAGINLRPLLYRFRKAETLNFDQRRGAAMDGFGNWYAIGPDERHITFLSRESSQPQRFWPPLPGDETCESREKRSGDFEAVEPDDPPMPLILRGMAATTHQFLVVGSIQPAGVLIFDIHGGGPPMWLPWVMRGAPASSAFRPFDIAPRAEGGVWILDFDPIEPSPESPRYWALDRYFRVEAPASTTQDVTSFSSSDFSPLAEGVEEGGVIKKDSALLSLDMALQLDLQRPVALESLPDDTVLILEVESGSGSTGVARYRRDRQIGETISLRNLLQAQLALGLDEKSGDTASWEGYDMAFVPTRPLRPREVDGTLFVVGRDGNQAFSFLLQADDEDLTLDLKDEYLPLRRFGGKAVVAAEQRTYYDLDDRWVRLVPQPKPRYCQAASVETTLFDGKEPDCVWHRLFLDACIPSGTSVRVESRASDDPRLLGHLSWDEEPRPYRRGTGPETPYGRSFSDEELRREGTGTWELAFQRAKGRYLQLRITLRGTGRSTPRINALRIHYPRFSYLREYLPDVYQEDAHSASFLDRFLANVEGTYTELEGRIAEVQQLFDERTVDDSYLDWLASWFGVLMEPTFTEEKRRLFLRHAVELFSQRGTLSGLMRTLRLALDPCPDDSIFQDADSGWSSRQTCRSSATVVPNSVRIVEQFLTRRVPGAVFGDPTDLPKPLLTSASDQWRPRLGAEPLHERYRAFLEERYEGSVEALNAAWAAEAGDSITFDDVKLSPIPPEGSGQRTDWRAFVRTGFGFQYVEASGNDAVLYRSFLRRRYRQIKRLNDAYGTAYGSFSDVGLPAENDFPQQNPRLRDWVQFTSLALPIERSAHRFTVLMPVEPGMPLSEQRRQMELIRRIVDREKPAHTEFDVKPYWALFLAGTARLGMDTLLGEGSRYVGMLLGQGDLGGTYLERRSPGDVANRFVTGRDAANVLL